MVARSLRALDSNRYNSSAVTADGPAAAPPPPQQVVAATCGGQSPCFDISMPTLPTSATAATFSIIIDGGSEDAVDNDNNEDSSLNRVDASQPDAVDEPPTKLEQELFPRDGNIESDCAPSMGVDQMAHVDTAAGAPDASDRRAIDGEDAALPIHAAEALLTADSVAQDAAEASSCDCAVPHATEQGDGSPIVWSRSVSLSLAANSPSSFATGGGVEVHQQQQPHEDEAITRYNGGSTLLIDSGTSPTAMTTRRQLELAEQLHGGNGVPSADDGNAPQTQQSLYAGAVGRVDADPPCVTTTTTATTTSGHNEAQMLLPQVSPSDGPCPTAGNNRPGRPSSGAIAFVTEFRDSVERTRASILSRLSDDPRGEGTPSKQTATSKRPRDGEPSISPTGPREAAPHQHRTEGQQKAVDAVKQFLSCISSEADHGFLYVKMKDALRKYASSAEAAVSGAEDRHNRMLMPLGTMMRILLRFVRATNPSSLTRQLTLSELFSAFVAVFNQWACERPVPNTGPANVNEDDDEDAAMHRPSAVEAMLSMATEHNRHQPFVAVVQRRRVSGNHTLPPPSPVSSSSSGGAGSTVSQEERTSRRVAEGAFEDDAHTSASDTLHQWKHRSGTLRDAMDRSVVVMNRVTSCMRGLRQRLSESPSNQLLLQGVGIALPSPQSCAAQHTTKGPPEGVHASGADEVVVIDTIDVPIRSIEYDIHSHSLCDVERFTDSMQQLRHARLQA